MNKLIVSMLGFVIIATGCQREVIDTKPPAPPPPTTDSTLMHVPYGEDASQKMDVYLPAYRTAKTKTIIYLHGGAWYQGDKDEATATAIYFQKKGYAFISMNYRLTKVPANTNPAQMQDVEKVLNLVSGKENEWKISGNKICLFGGSAGAHLSLLYAYKYKLDTRVKGVISVSGPTDLTDSLILLGPLQPYIQAFVGYEYSQNKNAYSEASPVSYVTDKCVPTLLIHGKADITVPYLESLAVYNILRSSGVNTTLTLFDGLGHDLSTKNDEIILRMEDFLKSAYQ